MTTSVLREWIGTPIGVGEGTGENQSMSQIAIRCRPCSRVAPAEMERWLNEEVTRIYDGVPEMTGCLWRLSREGIDDETGVGWQIELCMASSASPFDHKGLTELLRDLRLVGVEPSVLSEEAPSAPTVAR